MGGSSQTLVVAETLTVASHTGGLKYPPGDQVDVAPPHKNNPRMQMQAIQEAFDGLKGVFDFVSGANDVIVIRHMDGSVRCSVVRFPIACWHVHLPIFSPSPTTRAGGEPCGGGG